MAAIGGSEEVSEAETTEAAVSKDAPKGLACLAKHYGGTATSDAGSWSLALPNGTRLPWDDGRTKTFDAQVEAPDLEDTFSIPYVTGAIKPVTRPNDDPGRIRSQALLSALYGKTEAEVEARLVAIDFVGNRVRVHERLAVPFQNVSKRLKTAISADASLAPFLTKLGGTFTWRFVANTRRLSGHSFASAIDINVDRSDYWEWQRQGDMFVWKNRIPQAIVDAFEAEGFVWGGRWYHYDTMHFEYRPELLDPGCR